MHKLVSILFCTLIFFVTVQAQEKKYVYQDSTTIEKIVDPQEQMKIDKEIMGNGYVLKQQYLEKVYGTEIESMPSQTAADAETKGNVAKEGKDAKKP